MSGGQRIDDHEFWAGKSGKDSVFPKGVHTKDESSTKGAGSLDMYEDTSSKIKDQQETGVRKVKSHPTKPLYRN